VPPDARLNKEGVFGSGLRIGVAHRGSGCYGLRFASVLRTAFGRPPHPSRFGDSGATTGTSLPDYVDTWKARQPWHTLWPAILARMLGP
jgi:hypothetical protein